MPEQPGRGTIRRMAEVRYTAVWSDNGEPALAGVVEAGDAGLCLVGRNGARQALRRVRYDAIVGFRLERGARERLAGRPTIVLDVGAARPIRITTAEPGTLHELADRLSAAVNPHG